MRKKHVFTGFLLVILFVIGSITGANAQCSANAGVDTSICKGLRFTRTALFTPVAASVKWFQVGVATAVSSTPTIDLPMNTAGTFRFALEVSSALCAAPKYDTVVVVVNEVAVIPQQSITTCSGISFFLSPVNGVPSPNTIVPAGTTYTWTVVGNSNIVGSFNQATPVPIISQTITNLTNVNQTVVYTVTPNSSNCIGAPFTVTVTISPLPLIQNQSISICSGQLFSFSPTNNQPTEIVPTNTKYTWTVAPNTNVTGQSNQSTAQSTISQTLTNNTNVAQTVVYTVTPKSGSCTGAPFTVTVTIAPSPLIQNQSISICSGQLFSFSPINNSPLTIVPSSTTYTWIVAPNTNVTGESDESAPQSLISQTLTNNTNTAQTVVYTVTPKDGDCAGSAFTATVTINPKPTIPTQSTTISSGSIFNLTPVNNQPSVIVPVNTTYTWTVVNNANVTGESNQSVPQSVISQNLTNTTFSSQAVNYTITPVSGNCVGNPFIGLVTVNAGGSNRPTANFSISNPCGRAVQFTNQSSTPTGTTITQYQWTFNQGTTVLGTSSQANPTFTFPASGVTYNAQLVVTNSVGLKDSIRQNIITHNGPKALLVSEQSTTTINGAEYFFACTSGDSLFTFYNNSLNSTSTSTYIIRWGDGGSNSYSQSTFTSPASSGSFVTHNYNVGIYTLSFKMDNGSGCLDSIQYKVYVGSIPSGGIVGLPASTICAGGEHGVVISGTASNTPGTIYTLSYNDGSALSIFNAPISDPDTIYHTYNSSSCGTTSPSGSGSSFSNAFGAYLTIQSPCGNRAGSVVPIYVADKPKASFTQSVVGTICPGIQVTLTNTGNPGNNNVNGVCTPGKSVWQITPNSPGTRFRVIGSSTLGTVVSTNPNNWTPGSDSLKIIFDSVGTYTIRMISANNNICSRDTMTQTISVTGPTSPQVVSPVNYNQGAMAVPLTATGTGLRWYAAAVGGVGSTIAPTPSTANLGSVTYYVSQGAPNCEGARSSIVVNVSNGTRQQVGINVIQPQRSLHVNDMMRLEPRSAPPTNPAEGDIYYDGVLKKLRYYNGTTWKDL